MISALPVVVLLALIGSLLIISGPSAISDYSPICLLVAALSSFIIAALNKSLGRRGLAVGLVRSAKQILPAIPMLICIAMVSTTWMLSGVVPVLIEYGLDILNPELFLVICCLICGVISVLTGSSWSTIATIGVALMGIGTVLGFNPGWIAGAIISGAYFGDKVSPLSDTTVLSASTCGVDLFKHIRYLLITTLPSLIIALGVFLVAGFSIETHSAIDSSEILSRLNSTFNITPWALIIPAITLTMIALRVPTLITLFCSAMLGLAGIFIFQPAIVGYAGMEGLVDGAKGSLTVLWQGLPFSTGSDLFDNLVSTSGILGMLSTIMLVISAMIFGIAMIGTGMLSTLTHAITRKIRRRVSLVGTTVASGLFLNGCTADQYLSIIIGGNMYRNAYRRCGLEPRLLSRTLEDSISVTSVLIPWNSCGVTQSAVLGVSTFAYLPYCVFNYLSPLVTLLVALTGFKVKNAISTMLSDSKSPLPA